MTSYTIVLFRDPADAAWVADIPGVRSCSAHGETAQEASRNVAAAPDDVLADARAPGIVLPSPTERPTFARAS